MSRLIAIIFLVSSTALLPAQNPRPNPDAVLAGARMALGGDSRLAAVRTLTATGRTRQIRGENLVPIEFDIAIELPAKYARKDEVPAQGSGPTTLGFNGDDPIQEPPNAGPPAGRPGGPSPPTAEQLAAANRARVVGLKQDFARLMLGMFATSFPSYPLAFTYVGQAEAPEGMADVLEGKGAPNLTLRFFVSRDTHLPVLLTWQGPPPAGGRGVGPARGPDRADAPPPENRLYFADYREVDGVKLPFRLRRAIGPDTVEETIFDRFRLNARIDPKRFGIRR